MSRLVKDLSSNQHWAFFAWQKIQYSKVNSMVDSFLFFPKLLCAVHKKGVVAQLFGIALACFILGPGPDPRWITNQYIGFYRAFFLMLVKKASTFFTSVLMTSWTIHIIPHVCMAWSKSVYTVFLSEVVWLILRPVAEFKRTAIHPSEYSFSGNIIQTNPRLITIVPVLNIDIFFLAFNGG